jgi:WD40 repeat protein
MKSQPPPYFGHRRAVTALAYSDDGNWLASGSEDTTTRVWDLRRSSDRSIELSGHTGAIRAIAFIQIRNQPGLQLVTTGDDGTIRVWTVDRWALLKRAEELVRSGTPPVAPEKRSD